MTNLIPLKRSSYIAYHAAESLDDFRYGAHFNKQADGFMTDIPADETAVKQAPQLLPARERRFLLGVIWLVCTLFLCGLTIADPDLWGHTVYGLRALDAGILTERTDPFSYTANGDTWVNHEWLSETVYGALWLTGEGYGLVIWRNALVVGLMMLAAAAIRRAKCGAAAGTILLVLNTETLADFVVFIRPQLATFVLFALFLFAIKSYLEQPHRWIWVLPPSTALWVNLHGGFLAGLGILALFTCGAIVKALRSYHWRELVFSLQPDGVRTTKSDSPETHPDKAEAVSKRSQIPNTVDHRAARELFAVLVTSILATLVNPYGYVLHVMLWEHLVTKQLVREWQPIWKIGRGIVSAVPFILVGFALPLGRNSNEKSRAIGSHQALNGVEILVLLVVCWQAASHLRHVALLCITTLILLPGPLHLAISRSFQILIARWSQAKFKRRRAAGIGAIVLFLGMLQARSAMELWKHGVAPWEIAVETKSFVPGMPIDATLFIKQHQLKGNLLTDYGWGQFVIWHLFPDNHVGFDGRYRTVYSAKLEQDLIEFQISGVDLPALTPMLDEHPTEIALLPADKSPDKYLAQREDWACVFRDAQTALYVKRLERFKGIIDLAEKDRLTVEPSPKWTLFPGLPDSGTPVASMMDRTESLPQP